MGESRPQPDRPTRIKPMTLALTAAGVLAGWTALLPESVRPWNFAAIGAVGLFASARLRFGTAVAVVFLALAVKDIGYYLILDWSPAPLSWVAFLAYLLVGHWLLRNTESPLRIGAGAVLASLLFFVVSNFGAWVGQALPYGYSLAGLMDCYRAAIPFYRGTFAGDLAFTGLLFGLHAALGRAYFPAERVALQPEAVR